MLKGMTSPLHQTDDSDAQGASGSDPRQAGLTIALAVLGVFVTYVPITGVSVALTTIAHATHASNSGLQWVSDAYVIPMAAAVLSAGVFGDLFGRRRIYVLGMGLTVLGSAIAGTAAILVSHTASLHLLWAGQAVSGLGAGMLLPTTLALIGHAVPNPQERGKYIGIWATGLTLGLALGPIATGALLEFTSWGWVFAPAAVLAFVAGLVTYFKLPESKSPEGRTLDKPGQAMATVMIAASIYATIQGGESGWGDTKVIVGYAIALVGFIAFIAIERRSISPVMRLNLFRSPAFSASGFSALIALFSIVGAVFLLSLFLGYVQHLSALQIGIRLLFISGVSAAAGPFIGAVVMPRLHPILLLASGLAIAAVAAVLLIGVQPNTGFGDLAWRLAVFGVATAMILTSVSTAAISSVPWKLAGMAAAGNTAMRQYGGALGPAVLGVIFDDRVAAGATPTSALHTALIVDAALLGLGAISCVIALAWERLAGSAEIAAPLASPHAASR